MADIKVTPQLEQFMRDNQLDPFNHYAYAELLMRQQEQINETAKNIPEGLCNTTDPRIKLSNLFDKWNK